MVMPLQKLTACFSRWRSAANCLRRSDTGRTRPAVEPFADSNGEELLHRRISGGCDFLQPGRRFAGDRKCQSGIRVLPPPLGLGLELSDVSLSHSRYICLHLGKRTTPRAIIPGSRLSGPSIAHSPASRAAKFGSSQAPLCHQTEMGESFEFRDSHPCEELDRNWFERSRWPKTQ
jgi:hypothetical protein